MPWLGLVCSSATFVVWTSAGGLETRQFSFFVILAVVSLSLYRDRRHALLAVSLSLALGRGRLDPARGSAVRDMLLCMVRRAATGRHRAVAG